LESSVVTSGEFSPERDKGLKGNAIGLLSSVVIGVASTAPAYSLAVTLGLVAAVAGIGTKSPAIMIAAFIPMVLIAGSYYYLNKVDPDCGTTFMWVTRAFGPHVGWVTGWVMVMADIIVMASLAQITGTYFFLLFGLDKYANSVWWVTVVGVLFLVIMTIVTALGIELAAEIQWFLLGAEFLILMVFSITALFKVFLNHPPGSITPKLSWFSPFGLSSSALAGGVLLALFIYWGWDTAVSVNEETENKSVTPGVAAVVSTFLLLGIYVLVTAAAQSVHGVKFLADNAGDVLSPLGTDVLGSTIDKLLIIAVLTSATASTMTTILPGARTTLSMASHGAIPSIWARINPRFQTPVAGTVIYGVLSLIWYVGLTALSANVLADSIAALGLTIAFYYGINGYAVPWFYRHQVFTSARKFLMLLVFPILGALIMTWALVKSFIDLYNPANSSSGTSWFGVGPPFILGAGFILSGVVLMIVAAFHYKDFFRRKTETVETMVQDSVV
jgi:amino acid transporter